MANFKLNSVLVATESGGTVTLDSGTVVPAAGVTGVLPSAVTDNITTLGTVTAGNISNTAMVFPAGHVKNTWYKGSTLTTGIVIANTGTYQDCSCSANIDITSGNRLLLYFGGCVFASNAKHWSFNMFINDVEVGNVGWGSGIYHGTTTISGWMSFGSQTVYVISGSSGTYSCALKANCNTGSIGIIADGNSTIGGNQGENTGWGYDGFHWIAQEIQA